MGDPLHARRTIGVLVFLVAPLIQAATPSKPATVSLGAPRAPVQPAADSSTCAGWPREVGYSKRVAWDVVGTLGFAPGRVRGGLDALAGPRLRTHGLVDSLSPMGGLGILYDSRKDEAFFRPSLAAEVDWTPEPGQRLVADLNVAPLIGRGGLRGIDARLGLHLATFGGLYVGVTRLDGATTPTLGLEFSEWGLLGVGLVISAIGAAIEGITNNPAIEGTCGGP